MASLSLTALIVLAMIVAMARGTFPPALAVLSSVVLLLIADVITPAEAFSGFSNPAPITVAALFVLARAVERTGVLRPGLDWALRRDGSTRSNLARLLVPTTLSSAVLNNTPIVAVLTPQISAWALRTGRAAGLFLLPLSFATILGGTLTLVGTSTNLVISGLLEASGLQGLGMFEMTGLALPAAMAGLAVLLLIAPRILSGREGPAAQFEAGARDFVVEMEVVAAGPAVDRTVVDIGLRHLQGVFLARIERGTEVITPVGPGQRLMAGDRLQFVGQVDQIVDLQSIPGLRFAQQKFADGFRDSAHGFFEAVVGPSSSLVGQTLKRVTFREQYQAAVFAIHRAGHRVRDKLGDVELRAGDTLLLLADHGFSTRWRDRRDFLLISRLDGELPMRPAKAALALATIAAVVVLAAMGVVPILEGALMGALFVVATGALSLNEARNAVNFDVILLIAGAFGVGKAIEASGLADIIAGGLVAASLPLGPTAVLVAIALCTLMMTELITNNAAAALMFPIAMAAADSLGADPRLFAMVLALIASASFLSPIGYQANAMVYGPGGYRFLDYARLGLPVSLIFGSTVIVAAAITWNR